MSFYPTSPRDALLARYKGHDIRDVPGPAAVIDLAAVEKNCASMLGACDALGLEWRAHVKTHKTVELTKLQAGTGSRPVKLVVSTLSELDFLVPMLQDYRAEGRVINVLYVLPLAPSQVPRLAEIGKLLGPDSISIMIDHASQLSSMAQFISLAGFPAHAHLKIDMGGRRAGVVPGSEDFHSVVRAALDHHADGSIKLAGLYSHAGHSYGGDSQVAAMQMLRDELKVLIVGATDIMKTVTGPLIKIATGPLMKTVTGSIMKTVTGSLPPLTLSVGATPTALSIQNLLDSGSTANATVQMAAQEVQDAPNAVRASGCIPEIHAGVYPTLDLQQLATHSLSTSMMSYSDIAFTLVAEVCSVYPGRGNGGYPEVLIGAGGLALGRETCKAYPGMALLTPWNRPGVSMPTADVEDHRGWQVGRLSQEHGILTWSGGHEIDQLEVGQKVRLWPNHACITGSHFGWYYVVDSRRVGREDEVVDVWTKARGW